jgi:hypothetical protein
MMQHTLTPIFKGVNIQPRAAPQRRKFMATGYFLGRRISCSKKETLPRILNC